MPDLFFFSVEPERLTKLGPSWPFYQMSSELVSNLSIAFHRQLHSLMFLVTVEGCQSGHTNESAWGQKFFQSSWLSEIWVALSGSEREDEKAQHWKPLWIRVSKPWSQWWDGAVVEWALATLWAGRQGIYQLARKWWPKCRIEWKHSPQSSLWRRMLQNCNVPQEQALGLWDEIGWALARTSYQIWNLRKGCERHLHINVYVAVLTIDNLQNQPTCPTTEEWIKKMHTY